MHVERIKQQANRWLVDLFNELVRTMRPVVAELRGLPWKRDVDVEILSRSELRAYMKAGLDRDVTPVDGYQATAECVHDLR